MSSPRPADRGLEDLDDLTGLMRDWRAGDETAGARLVERLYPWFHAMTRRQLSGFPGATSLDTTELLHDAYLRLADRDHDAWRSRADFIGIAVTVVRRVMIDQLRHRHRAKRRGDLFPLTASALERALAIDGRPVDAIDLDRALDRLARIDDSAARLVELRFFGGLSLEEAADQLRIGRSTAVRSWRWARAFLRAELTSPTSARKPATERPA
jgi:RNA polymerase sigma factor (TIGR02999 family)